MADRKTYEVSLLTTLAKRFLNFAPISNFIADSDNKQTLCQSAPTCQNGGPFPGPDLLELPAEVAAQHQVFR